MTSRFYI